VSHYETTCDGTPVPYQIWPDTTEGLDMAADQARVWSISSPHAWAVRAVPDSAEPYILARYAAGRPARHAPRG
jgi:hypothetical protein